MQKFNVRSNCISPFAWSRMIGSIPTETPEEQARVDRLKQMTPAKIAPLAVCLASDAGEGRQRPDLRGAQQRDLPDEPAAAGALGAPQRGLDARRPWRSHALPALKASFLRARPFGDVFSWDPI